MGVDRGSIHWADLGDEEGSKPANRRPVLVVSANSYNSSKIATVVALVITSSTRLAVMPGNVFLPKDVTGLSRDSVVNVTGIVTLDKSDLIGQIGTISPWLMLSLIHI